jgi:hypothetical protein
MKRHRVGQTPPDVLAAYQAAKVSRGERRGGRAQPLSSQEIQEIRQLWQTRQKTQIELAVMYRVSQVTISRVIRGKSGPLAQKPAAPIPPVGPVVADPNWESRYDIRPILNARFGDVVAYADTAEEAKRKACSLAGESRLPMAIFDVVTGLIDLGDRKVRDGREAFGEKNGA